MSSVGASREWTLRDAFVPGVAAVRAHWPPFLLIQGAAAALAFAYYGSPFLQNMASGIMAWKVAGGLPFAFLVGVMAGGVVPEIAKALTGRLRRFDGAWLSKAGFTGMVYGIVATEVDVFYRFQAIWFGDGRDPLTLGIKTAVDMFAFSPLLCVPTAVLLFRWRKHGYAFRHGSRAFSWRFYRARVLPAMIPCWAFWIPILLCVYAMPTNLQFVFSQLAEAAWSILFVFIATGEHETD
ncbi:MAG: hypothetical protein KIS66_13500 [Fimbriimonadaceae bacterium]|nr:hypothetical protein [Fimbriimonadaceae bacterium]